MSKSGLKPLPELFSLPKVCVVYILCSWSFSGSLPELRTNPQEPVNQFNSDGKKNTAFPNSDKFAWKRQLATSSIQNYSEISWMKAPSIGLHRPPRVLYKCFKAYYMTRIPHPKGRNVEGFWNLKSAFCSESLWNLRKTTFPPQTTPNNAWSCAVWEHGLPPILTPNCAAL